MHKEHKGNIMKHKLRIIGDVHGHSDQYVRLCKKASYTLQLGDNNFDYSYMSQLNPNYHKFFGGNHDNYDKINNQLHCLGDFGIYHIKDFCDIFFVRGGYSIDKWHRTEGKSWWRDEELCYRQAEKALRLYQDMKPTFVVSHECPLDILSEVIYPGKKIKTKTNQLLNEMLSFHRPKMWIFGHYHKSWNKLVDCTRFICLNELETLDFDRNI